MDLLPAALWGSPVLILEGASGVLDVLPRGDPAANGVVTRIQVALGKGGTAKAHVVQEMRAAEAYRIKENVKNAQKSDIQTYAAQRANQLFTGASVKSWKSPSLEDPNVPFTFVLDLTAEKVVRPRGDGTLTVSSLIEPRNLKRTLGGRATRKFDLVLGGWTSLRDEVELDLGPYTASRLPGDVQQQSHFGQYSLTFRRAGDKILIERTLTLEPQRVTPAEYKSFLAFLDKVDSAERRPLVVDEKSDAPGKGETKPESGGKR